MSLSRMYRERKVLDGKIGLYCPIHVDDKNFEKLRCFAWSSKDRCSDCPIKMRWKPEK